MFGFPSFSSGRRSDRVRPRLPKFLGTAKPTLPPGSEHADALAAACPPSSPLLSTPGPLLRRLPLEASGPVPSLRSLVSSCRVSPFLIPVPPPPSSPYWLLLIHQDLTEALHPRESLLSPHRVYHPAPPPPQALSRFVQRFWEAGVEHQLRLLPAASSWPGTSPALGFGFLICKLEMVTVVPTSKGGQESK